MNRLLRRSVSQTGTPVRRVPAKDAEPVPPAVPPAERTTKEDAPKDDPAPTEERVSDEAIVEAETHALELAGQLLEHRGGLAIAQEVPENVLLGGVGPGVGLRLAAHPRAGRPGEIVEPTLLRIGQDSVRLADGFEALLGGGVTSIPIGMVMKGELPVRLADFLGRSVLLQAENLVVFLGRIRAKRHGSCPPRPRRGVSLPSG